MKLKRAGRQFSPSNSIQLLIFKLQLVASSVSLSQNLYPTYCTSTTTVRPFFSTYRQPYTNFFTSTKMVSKWSQRGLQLSSGHNQTPQFRTRLARSLFHSLLHCLFHSIKRSSLFSSLNLFPSFQALFLSLLSSMYLSQFAHCGLFFVRLGWSANLFHSLSQRWSLNNQSTFVCTKSNAISILFLHYIIYIPYMTGFNRTHKKSNTQFDDKQTNVCR